jgi:hypothetical protein
MVDWEALRLQYELFHEDPANLAKDNGIDISIVEYAIKEQEWTRAPLKGMLNEVKDIKDLDVLTDDIMDAVRDRLGVLNTLKAVALNPRYVELEMAIVNKAKDIVNSLIPEAPSSSDQLKKVSEVLEKLRAQSIPAIAGGGGMETDDNRVVVQIMNNVDLIQQEPKPVVQVGDGSPM